MYLVKKWIAAIALVSGMMLNAQTPQFKVIGYVPNWIDVESFAKSFNYNNVTHVNYAFQNPDANGNLIESNTGLNTLVSKAHENNVKVMISIGGAAGAEGSTKTNFQNLIKTEELRAGFIHKIMEYVRKYNLDGVDIDQEGPAINNDYTPFISQLRDSLIVDSLFISAAVGWGGDKIENSVLPLFDWICIMAYDLTGPWNMNNPGPHSPYSYAASTINHWIGRGVKKENLVLGVPFYGYDFSIENGYTAYKDIIARFPNAFKTDQVNNIFYNGMPTIQKKTQLAMQKTSGVMIWELSQDVSGEKSLLQVINNTIDSIDINIDSIEVVGIKANIGYNEDICIYPNPAKDYLMLQFKNHIADNYIVTNQIGQTLLKGFVEGTEVCINVKSLNAGVYFIKLTSVDSNYCQKFVVR
jgi:GH18 family chitinase